MKHDDLARILSLISFLRSRPRIQFVPGTEDAIRCVTTIVRCKTCGRVRLLIVDPDNPETIGIIDETQCSDFVAHVLQLPIAVLAQRLSSLRGMPFLLDHDCQIATFYQRRDYLAARFHRARVSRMEELLRTN